MKALGESAVSLSMSDKVHSLDLRSYVTDLEEADNIQDYVNESNCFLKWTDLQLKAEVWRQRAMHSSRVSVSRVLLAKPTIRKSMVRSKIHALPGHLAVAPGTHTFCAYRVNTGN